MKAIICIKYGPPGVLQLREVEKPVPKNNEVCVKIHATAVTASDCIVRGFKIPRWHLRGLLMGAVLGFSRPRNPILGILMAGKIDSVGSEVKLFQPGDEVFAWTVSSPVKIKFGSYAGYNCLPEDGIIALKPFNLTFEETAAIPYGGLIALHYLKKGKVSAGQKVLIYGASGSIGTSATQIAKQMGAHVTGVCSTSNMEMVQKLGADEVIDYTKNDVLKGDEYFDFILDAVGKWKDSKLKQSCKKQLKPNGLYISVDDGSPIATVENLNLLKKMAEADQLKPVIDRTYTLEQIVEAHEYVDKGHKKGNVIIKII